MKEKSVKQIAILGSTGSIGTQALDVIGRHPDKFQVEVLTAHRNADLLIRQALAFQPNVVVIADESQYEKVQEALAASDIKVYTGEKALSAV
ncbi:MAG: 1-deoxy-D-xylulose-5-phosphate reductoisomerase, partial [Cyclobacteriaceae bacterium]|nr:1-deoxy-D-xylulose-5-phosphate reductoisomerase [Cyclobacteriaceae bacterium]